MVLLSQNYNPSVYDSLGNLVIVSKLVAYKDICNVGEIIIKYGYQDSLSCLIAHRHFDLLPNEAMFEYIDGDASLSKPYKLEEISKMEVYPNVISLGHDQIWYPVNYSSGRLEIPAWEDDAFLNELASFLIQNDLQDKIMIGFRGKNVVFGENVKTMERNYNKTRTSEVRIANGEEDEKDAIQTAYVFKRIDNSISADGTQDCSCTHVCIVCWCTHGK